MSQISVLILMGSDSDAPIMQGAVEILRELQIPCEMTVASAHRSPERVMRLVAEAPGRGVKVFICAAGGAAVGAVGGAIGGDVGERAAMGAGMRALFGAIRRARERREQEQAMQSYATQQQSAMSQGRSNYERAFSACMAGRGYTVR